MVKKSGTKKQYENNAKRYIRKSLEALDKYENVDNRNAIQSTSKKVTDMFAELLNLLKKKHNKKARQELDKIFTELADVSYKKFMAK